MRSYFMAARRSGAWAQINRVKSWRCQLVYDPKVNQPMRKGEVITETITGPIQLRDLKGKIQGNVDMMSRLL